MPDDQIVAVYQAHHTTLLEKLSAAVAAIWDGLGSWNDVDIARFVEQIDPVLVAAETRMATMVDAYVARLAGTLPLGIEPVTNPRGLDPAELWRRPFLDTWTALQDGADPADSLDIGRTRVQQISSLDVQRTQVQAMTDIVDQSDEITGYRRTLTGKSCRFCVAASTQTYHGKNLMPLHTHCDCGVAPIIGDRDPGLAANRSRLKALKAQGPDYWKQSGFVDGDGHPLDPTKLPSALARIEHNAEVGPVLNTAA